MDIDRLAEKENKLSEAMDFESARLQVALIYHENLSQDYSWEIDRLKLNCEAIYHRGREILEQIKSEKGYINADKLSQDENLSLKETGEKYLEMEDPGEAEELVEQHRENLNKAEFGIEGRLTGNNLQASLQAYEELRATARELDVYNFRKIEDTLRDASIQEDTEILE